MGTLLKISPLQLQKQTRNSLKLNANVNTLLNYLQKIIVTQRNCLPGWGKLGKR